MSDLISRQAAINLTTDMEFMNSTAKGILRNRLRKLSSADVPQWIPCDERLPNEEDYKSCYGYEDGAVWWLDSAGLMGLGWYYTSTKNWAFRDEITCTEKYVGNVIAWMPLPEPYKEG